MSVVTLDRVLVQRPGWPVAIQLARREGRRMLRHPVMWVGALLSLALFGLFTWHLAPVLHREDASAAGSLLPLACATLIVAHLAMSRAARNATEELYETTASSSGLRTLGHLASLAYAVGLGILLLGVMFVYMLFDSPVGSPSPAELAGGLGVVVLFGAIGIAVGRWKPHPALGPMAVVVAVGLEILLIQPIVDVQSTNAMVATRAPWLAPWVPTSMTGEVAPELVVRPSGWHLLYLIGLVIVVAAFALSRSGRRPRFLPLFVAGSAAIALGMVGQFTPANATQRAALASLLEHPEEHQMCEERRGVTYCAYPAYVPWIDRWAAPVEGALDRIPEDARPEGLIVRQRFSAYFEGPVDVPEEVLRRVQRVQRREAPDRAPGTTIWTDIRWGRGSSEGGYEIGLALAVSMQAVDFPSSRSEMVLTPAERARFKRVVLPQIDERFQAKAERLSRRRGSGLYSCTTARQARAMVAMWIAAQATPDTQATVRRAAAENPYGLMVWEHEGTKRASYIGPYMPLYPQVSPPMWDRVQFNDVEFHHAAQLLDEPADGVASVIGSRWEEIVEPTTLTDSLLDDLGITPHPTLDDLIDALPKDVRPERGRKRWSPDASFGWGPPCF